MSTVSTKHHPTTRAELLLALLLVLLPLSSVQALQSDRNQPLYVNSNSFKAEQNNHIAHLFGNVQIRQGSLNGTADKAVTYMNQRGHIIRIVLNGTPAHLSQKLDNGSTMQASATTIDYDVSHDTATLTGHAIVIQPGQGRFEGYRLVYNTQTGEITGNSDGKGRVHLIFQAKSTKKSVPTALAKPTSTHPAPTGTVHSSGGSH